MRIVLSLRRSRIACGLVTALLAIPGCGIINFGMNLQDRTEINRLYRIRYVEAIESIDAENAARKQAGEDPVPVPTFQDWCKDEPKTIERYGTYRSVCARYPELNAEPIGYSEWLAIPEDERPDGEEPRPRF